MSENDKLSTGQKVHRTLIERYGEEYIAERSAKGGRAKVPKGFAVRRDLAANRKKKTV